MEVEQAKQSILIPTKIAFLFIAISVGWFVFSDYIAIHFFQSQQQAEYYLHIFQFAYLILAAAALYYFVKAQLTKQLGAQQSIQTLLTQAPTAIAVMDEQGNFIEVNNAYAKLLGYGVEAFKNINYFELINPSFVTSERSQQLKLNKTELECHYCTQYLHQQGDVIAVEQNLRLIEMNHQPAIVIFIDEIATIKNTSAQLMQSQQKFFKAFYFQPISMLIFNVKTGERVEFNEGFCKLTEYTREQLERGNLFNHDIFPDEQKLREGIAKLITQGEVHDFEAQIKTRQGHIKQCLLNASMLGDENDELAIVSHIDVTEQRHLFDNLTQTAITTSLQPSEQFFNQLVLHLAKAFEAQHALVGKLTSSGTSIECLAMCSYGELTDNIEYQLAGTPCAHVMDKQICVIEQHCASQFPDDALLQQMSIQGYIGVPILQQEQQAIGILVLLFEQPFEQKPYYQSLLKIFAAKVSQELRHLLIMEQMRRSEQHLMLYREQAPLASIEWDLEFNVLNWNQAAEQMFGYTFAEITNIDFVNKLVPDDDKPQVIAICESLLAEQGGNLSVNHIITKAGKKILCEWHNKLIKDQFGHAIGSTSIVRDITEEMRNMHMLVQKENEQRDLLDSMLDAVLTVDEQGHILTVNKAAERLFGIKEAQVLQQTIDVLFHQQEQQPSKLSLQQLLKSHSMHASLQGIELIGLHHSGKAFPMRLSLATLASKGQNKRRYVVNCQDISLLKQQQEQIQRIQKMDALGKLTGGIAHDFNNILGAISGYSELLSAQLTGQAGLKKYAEQVYKASQRGADLTRKLLSFSRQQPKQSKLINVNQQLKQLYDMLAKTLTASIHIKLNLADDLGAISIDPSEFSDLVLNLSINAKHAMPQGGELSFTSHKVCLSTLEAERLMIAPGDYVRLDIQDTGTGMSKEVQRRIFEPFYTTKGDDGTGLGLAQVYGCMNAAQGAISVYSELGQGSCFSLFFPMQQTEIKATKKVDKHQPLQQGNATILVVDDEPDLCEVAKAMLEQQGYQVITANSAEQALSILAADAVDLLLSDIIMPKISGYQLAETVKQQYPDLAIVFASGFQGEQKLAQSLGIEVIDKPYNKQKLLFGVQQTLKQYQHSTKKQPVKSELSSQTKQNTLAETQQRSAKSSISPELDQQHLVLTHAFQTLQTSMQQTAIDEPALAKQCQALISQLKQHFEQEQAFMRAVNYPHQDNHQQVHQMLVRQLEQQQKKPIRAQADWLRQNFYELYQEHASMMDSSLANFVVTQSQTDRISS